MTLYGKMVCLQPGATMKKIIIANYYSISAHLIINHKLTNCLLNFKAFSLTKVHIVCQCTHLIFVIDISDYKHA